ncbi:hypothetical protein D3C87_2123250 [compost metagenome]
MVHIIMLDVAVVHKEKLFPSGFSGKFRLTYVTTHTDVGSIFLAKGQLFAISAAVYINDPADQFSRM